GDLEADRLGALGVERPQVHVDQAPAVLERHLRAEAVYLLVGAAHPDQPGPRDAPAPGLCPPPGRPPENVNRRPPPRPAWPPARRWPPRCWPGCPSRRSQPSGSRTPSPCSAPPTRPGP